MIQAFTALHVLSMFIAFGFTTGVGILLATVTRSGDVRAIRAAAHAGLTFQIVGGIVLIVGLVLGIGLASMAGYALTARWIVIAYVLSIGLLALGLGFFQPWTRRLAAAAAASPDGEPSPGMLAIAHHPMNRIAGPVSGLLWIAVIIDMVVKP